MMITRQVLPAHTIRSLLPPLGVMEELGFSREACLHGTGISARQLEDPEARMTLRQELTLYRNCLELTGDPAIGLRLGEPFLPQRYGLFGYALLSAATFRHALSLAQKFGRLTFSFFSFRFGATGRRAWFSMSDPPPIEDGLIDLYLDRDMSAAQVDFGAVLGQPFCPDEVHLAHDGHGREQVYRDHFGCEVKFGVYPSGFVFPSTLLDRPLPESDPEFARHLQQQCQMRISRPSGRNRFIDDVRMLILARPGYFPHIESVAEKLGMATRTLRRRLRDEGSSYRALLEETRFGLARQYLSGSELSMEEIATLLGYTEPGTFSHAFRRWSGETPSAWRRRQS
jgi:AraC-like DNA-binding protein